MPAFYDAHVHLAESGLKPFLDEILNSYHRIEFKKAVIVGTSPDDWADVLELSAKDERFIPAIGLHPWKLNEAPEDWQKIFLSHLDQGIKVIGEIGLDQWIHGHDIERQQEAFIWQMAVAAERNLPTSIHCLKAHEPLLKTLRSIQLPERGFKLHAYNGPIDTLKPLLEMGAYFSCNAGQLKPNAKRAPEFIKLVPDDRLLIETDAPDFLPRSELREFEFPNSATADNRPPINHPGNIRAGYHAIAEVREQPFPELAKKIALNFERYFLS